MADGIILGDVFVLVGAAVAWLPKTFRVDDFTLSARMLCKKSSRLMGVLGRPVGALVGALVGASLCSVLGSTDGVVVGAAVGLEVSGTGFNIHATVSEPTMSGSMIYGSIPNKGSSTGHELLHAT